VRLTNITRELPFLAIIVLLTVFALINGYFAGKVNDQNVYPVTFLMVQAVEGNATLFLFIIATLYAGELIWRERDTSFSGIHDALPMGETTDWLSKFIALTVVEGILLAVILLCGVIMQTTAGYYHYDLLQYFKELYLIAFPLVISFILLAFFVQTVVSNKFMGHAIVIGIFVLGPIMFRFGIENTLLLPGQNTPYTYSDMNGYGHFVPGLLWSLVYWTAIFAVLGCLSIALARRGAEDGWHPRLLQLRARLPRLTPALVLFTLIAIGSGSWFYYNAHESDRRRRRRRPRPQSPVLLRDGPLRITEQDAATHPADTHHRPDAVPL
jgi:ABC-2 type transport system permease protein